MSKPSDTEQAAESATDEGVVNAIAAALRMAPIPVGGIEGAVDGARAGGQPSRPRLPPPPTPEGYVADLLDD